MKWSPSLCLFGLFRDTTLIFMFPKLRRLQQGCPTDHSEREIELSVVSPDSPVVRPDSLTDATAVTGYTTHRSPTRSALFNPGRTIAAATSRTSWRSRSQMVMSGLNGKAGCRSSTTRTDDRPGPTTTSWRDTLLVSLTTPGWRCLDIEVRICDGGRILS